MGNEKPEINKPKPPKWMVQAVGLALERTQEILREPQSPSYDEIHKVKSILYAAIEQLGTRVEHYATVQRMMRELFAIINTRADISFQEKEVGRQIMEDITRRYGPWLFTVQETKESAGEL